MRAGRFNPFLVNAAINSQYGALVELSEASHAPFLDAVKEAARLNGAALYFHHRWDDFPGRSRDPFPAIKNHVLLPYARALAEADREARRLLTPAKLRAIVGAIPAAWLDAGEAVDAHRQTYLDFLLDRLEGSQVFLEEAEHARAAFV